MRTTANLAFELTEQGYVPDLVVRRGIQHLLKQRLQEVHGVDAEASCRLQQSFIEAMRAAPVALVPDKANEQHYELPAEFFRQVLGPHLKYSCGYWPEGVQTLAHAEEAALSATCQHAGLQDHQQILELGCGWGSLTVWMARQYPHSRITAVSNSVSQAEEIRHRLQDLGLDNVEVITCDMNDFQTDPGCFDRVVSVEMFEHMRNWPELFRRIYGWLRPGGRFFMHVFAHRGAPYAFEDQGPRDWMSRHFFSGGMMPSDDLPLFFQDRLQLLQRWRWDGGHYQKTANAWLANMDRRKPQLSPLFDSVYGLASDQWWTRWRMFFMACAELFGYDRGQQWWVSHYLFERPAALATPSGTPGC
jgi:cyclopropane-fatty-acyl-phospholipid synthase